ncbi:MAG TPA: glycosyltransferase [Actinomycetota bacterium]|nr:glycosyltransferase [Actinomycetota bacterium]
MKLVYFTHSLVSDWNHGNAHFLRGVVAELMDRGHEVEVFEPADSWSRNLLLRERGLAALTDFRRAFPTLESRAYDSKTIDLHAVLDGADLVLVHEWNDPELIHRAGVARRSAGFRLLFHDTHHRAATAPEDMERLDLSEYDGVLAFGAVIRDIYLQRGWTQRAWTWHEAADTRVFGPRPELDREREVVWIGNWGDDERAQELEDFLFRPADVLDLRGAIYGVRYPRKARKRVERAGLEYRGWLPNHRVPQAFARHRFTVHVPRRPYVRKLPGIPTIRVFEALACGIPLLCAPWEDAEGLFRPGDDFLVAKDTEEMTSLMKELVNDDDLARSLAEHGRETILERHTCAHRVDELLTVYEELS